MSLLQMERMENDKNDPNASIWMQSTDERVKAGLCIENTLLIKQEKAPVSTAWILYFKCLNTFSKFGFEEGDMVLVSTVHGGWGKALGKVEALTYSNNQVDQSGLTTDDNHCILVVSSPSNLPANEHYRIDHYRSYDMSMVLVNSIASFVTMDRSSEKNCSGSVSNPSLNRFREIVIEGKLPQMSHCYSSVEQILNSIEDQKMLLLLNGDEWNEKDDHLFSVAQSMINNCNIEQKQAIVMCFNCEDLAILRGLPGTGKTTVITIITLLYVLQKKRVFITSHTHTAIDNVLVKLAPYSMLEY